MDVLDLKVFVFLVDVVSDAQFFGEILKMLGCLLDMVTLLYLFYLFFTLNPLLTVP